ncbi:MAG: hypothetical protein RO257_11370 [Candidatus Kapabacteria bacterium]|nr:hypothetical protein [Candidatus Kapabacteria bacterium]
MMNTIIFDDIVKNLDFNEKISLIEMILDDIKHETEKFVDGKKSSNKIDSLKIADFKFCGIWADNDTLNNSSDYVRNIRTQEFRVDK